MFESATDSRHQDAIRAAHLARGELVAVLWNAVFARRR